MAAPTTRLASPPAPAGPQTAPCAVPRAAPPAPGPWPHRCAVTTAVATVFLLVAGALVTSTASGDAVPDWWFVPISYGTLLPPAVGAVWIEHGHRLVATAVGLLTIALLLALRRDDRPWVRRLGPVALTAVVLQGVLGGLRVLKIFPPPVAATAHAALAQAFFGLTVAIAVFTSPGWRRATLRSAGDPGADDDRGLLWLAAATTALVFLQAVAGAVTRHTGSAITVHVYGAMVVMAAVALTLGAAGANPALGRPLRRTAFGLAAGLALQLALGLVSFLIVARGGHHAYDAPLATLAVLTGHLLVGALFLATSLVLTLWAWRPAGCPPAAAPGTTAMRGAA